jgi:hypothetical protein
MMADRGPACFQVSTFTQLERYPKLFDDCRSRVGDGRNIRLLSLYETRALARQRSRVREDGRCVRPCSPRSLVLRPLPRRGREIRPIPREERSQEPPHT